MRRVDYRTVERMLYTYKELIAKYKLAVKEREIYDVTEDGLNAVSYDNTSSGKTNKINRSVEITVERRAKELERLNLGIRQMGNKIKRIDNILAVLPEEQKKLLQLFYFESYPWTKISIEMNYSVSWCKKTRKKTIEMIVKLLNI